MLKTSSSSTLFYFSKPPSIPAVSEDIRICLEPNHAQLQAFCSISFLLQSRIYLHYSLYLSSSTMLHSNRDLPPPPSSNNKNPPGASHSGRKTSAAAATFATAFVAIPLDLTGIAFFHSRWLRYRGCKRTYLPWRP